MNFFTKISRAFKGCALFKASPYFDAAYYAKRYRVPAFLCAFYDMTIGRKYENNPSPYFDAKKYYADNPDVKAAGENALYHYIVCGEKEYRPIGAKHAYDEFFDPLWYASAYMNDEERRTIPPRVHYLTVGAGKRYLPFELFDTERFYRENPGCDREPLDYWYEHRLPAMYFTEKALPLTDIPRHSGAALQFLFKTIQDANVDGVLPRDNDFEKLLVLIVPPEDIIGGGVMSFCGMYRLFHELADLHGRRIIAVTLPCDLTHCGFTMFKNDMPVYRYEQLQSRTGAAEDILVMLPEIYAGAYYEYLRENPDDCILRAQKRHLNILNQNIELMAGRETVDNLKNLFGVVTQTTAHSNYCTADERDRLGIATHWLRPPIYKEYAARPYEKKEELFLYSCDTVPWKESVLTGIREACPDLSLREIKGLRFEEYLELIGRAKWCMTFGEGLDGYFIEPYKSGGISFAVWNDRFFTSAYRGLPTIFPDPEYAAAHIAETIKRLDNKDAYDAVLRDVLSVLNAEYSNKRTARDQLIDFFEGNYDFP